MANKITLHSLPDLKNTTDDALPNYLTSLKFKQSHFYADVRLALGYTAVVIAAATFYFDWTLGWDKTKYWTAWAVVFYFGLNGAFTYWMWYVEKGLIFTGEKDGIQLTISSRTEQHVPTYYLTVRSKKSSSGTWKESKIKAPFTRWFSADGFFVPKPFQQWLASEIGVVGEADPSNVVEDIGRGSSNSLNTTLESKSPSSQKAGSTRSRRKA
ncbi:hypothetical protein EV356DRAFT_332594 [Viridothelium virens]|uniref:Signal peptidase complex subunit 2 n=1 Tax=Viridothelium virens TaxID=1048519 RepID=A0A6A6HIY7_VIRVR|nr:hypothetical protein EV356DRAFT_332594 [Viridothelium virens]